MQTDEKPAASDLIDRTMEALKANPNNAELHNNLGVLYFKNGRVDDAIREFRDATRLKPDFDRARINLANAFLSRGVLDNAIREYREVLKAGQRLPTSTSTWRPPTSAGACWTTPSGSTRRQPGSSRPMPAYGTAWARPTTKEAWSTKRSGR